MCESSETVGKWCQLTNVNQETVIDTWLAELRQDMKRSDIIARSPDFSSHAVDPPSAENLLQHDGVVQIQGRPAGGRSEDHSQTSDSRVPQLIYSCVDGILHLFIVFIYLLAAEFYCLLCTSIVWPSMWWQRRCCWQFVGFWFFLLLSLGGGGDRRKWKCSDWIIGLLCLFYQIGCV